MSQRDSRPKAHTPPYNLLALGWRAKRAIIGRKREYSSMIHLIRTKPEADGRLASATILVDTPDAADAANVRGHHFWLMDTVSAYHH